MISSDIKILDYLKSLSKQDTVIEFDNNIIDFKKKDKIVIKPSFFLKDYCQLCGACCKDWGNAYFATEFDEMVNEELKQSLSELLVKVNGIEKVIYFSKPLPNSKLRVMETRGRTMLACRYCENVDGKNVCKIHNERGFTCKFPHIRFHEGKNSTSISLGEFGRNWALKCPITFKDSTDLVDEDTLRDRIELFKNFYEKSKYLGIQTYLPEIISKLEEVLEQGITYKQIVINS